MSHPRLNFLYPVFYRSVRSSKQSSLRTAAVSASSRLPSRAHLSISAHQREEGARPQRYGTANAPPPHLSKTQPATASSDRQLKPPPKTDENAQSTKTDKAPTSKESTPQESTPTSTTPEAGQNPQLASYLDPKGTPSNDSSADPEAVSPEDSADAMRPLETVLQMPSPSSNEAREALSKTPHLTAPPYVHHFDTWSLVRDLEHSNFNQAQSVSLMKAVRGILAENMELARGALVSKSNVENETYLFRAACSELKTEVQRRRREESESMRGERTQLQHEADILNQKVTQESATLKDELKGMFDDRKMTVRMEQRNLESKIQELNYSITVALNSDARSEVEGLRWVLTRRAAAALGLCALMILATLRYASYMQHLQDVEREKIAKRRKASSNKPPKQEHGDEGRADSGSPVNPIAEEALIGREGEAGYVSLG
ncbi:hypothetical protein K402DRAFT_369979 [Aulographum hederae CBS 113979]|uniref:DUF1640-domain-containing protein n=1 Tax=Aulographum hederae CBS 113979 TaxID=1176131 RepID=A0A6G1HDA8_9PEZI|nr:hypothetical protein K402DRAFT_369979 [Aulographum hederae CBS 113979]